MTTPALAAAAVLELRRRHRARLALARVVPFDTWKVGRSPADVAAYHEIVSTLRTMACEPEAEGSA